MFKCKCCEVLKAENEHLRNWIDRLMLEKAPMTMDDQQEKEYPVEDDDEGRITEIFGES